MRGGSPSLTTAIACLLLLLLLDSEMTSLLLASMHSYVLLISQCFTSVFFISSALMGETA